MRNTKPCGKRVKGKIKDRRKAAGKEAPAISKYAAKVAKWREEMKTNA